jgi:hypothetical protein
MTDPETSPTRIMRLVGVYDADGTLRGEVAYWVGARLGRRHCSLCEVTHGVFRKRSEWTTCRSGLPIPFDTYHRDDQPDAVRVAAEGRYPIVVAETAVGHVVLLTPAELDALNGSVDRLLESVETAAIAAGLAWSAPG